MKRIIYGLFILFLTSICIFGFTFIPSLFTYTASDSDYEKVYTQLQETLKPITEQGILSEDDITAMIQLDDLKHKTAKENIEIRINDYLKQTLKKQHYLLGEDQIKTISSSIISIYEQYIPRFHTSDILDKTRTYILVVGTISGISLLLCMMVVKRKQTRIPS